MVSEYLLNSLFYTVIIHKIKFDKMLNTIFSFNGVVNKWLVRELNAYFLQINLSHHLIALVFSRSCSRVSKNLTTLSKLARLRNPSPLKPSIARSIANSYSRSRTPPIPRFSTSGEALIRPPWPPSPELFIGGGGGGGSDGGSEGGSAGEPCGREVGGGCGGGGGVGRKRWACRHPLAPISIGCDRARSLPSRSISVTRMRRFRVFVARLVFLYVKICFGSIVASVYDVCGW